MNIAYQSAAGEQVSGVGITVTAQFTPGLGELAQPVYTTPSGTTPVQTDYTSGSPAQVMAGDIASGYFVRFFSGESKTLLVTKFRMDDAQALADAADTYATAFAADPNGFLILMSDGSAGS